MATIVNTPGVSRERESDSIVGSIVTGLVLVILAVLFFVYALPALRGAATPADTTSDVNVNLPDLNTGGGSTVNPGTTQ